MNGALIVLLTLHLVKNISTEQNSYRAAVLEYPPLNDGTPIENWEDNLKEILHFVRDAANQKAQIIVLPEVALSGWDIDDKYLDALSTEVPEAAQHVLPCTVYHTNNFSSTLRDLSCAAQTYKIYVVANLIEKAINPLTKKPAYYNTNVVFDRRGEVIARYRKINLYNEPSFESGNEIVTFTTDFGVTFGTFICFDLVFDNPSVKVLSNPNVTDIAYPAGWFSHLPFYQSLSVQHGYAKANGVNLLAAGLNDPSHTNGGSGIYLADGRITETFISGTPLSKLIVQDVPKIKSRIPNSSCKFQKSSGSYEWGVDPITGNISGFVTIQEDMSNYTFKSLNLLEKRVIEDTVCSGTSGFCCTFNITSSRIHNVQPNYVYKLAAFQGAWRASSSGTIGLRNCGIVACLSEDTSTCGQRKVSPPTGIAFEKIHIKATVDNNHVRYQPVTVTYDLKPTTDYTFCATEYNGKGKIDIEMETADSQDTLLSFGILGRAFDYDGLPAGPINGSAASCINVFCVISIVLYSLNILT